jgi:hypothetical protein
MIQESRDLIVRILKNRRIFEIPLEENIKHAGIKIRVNNRQATLIISCSLSDKQGSYNNELARTLPSQPICEQVSRVTPVLRPHYLQ